MGNAYLSIQPLAFTLNVDAPDLVMHHYSLSLPLDYKQALKRAYARKLGRKPEEVNLPVADLNRLVRLLLPDVYSISSGAGNTNPDWDSVWLRAAQEIDLESVKTILDEWANVHNMGSVDVPENLTWKNDTVQLGHWETSKNGTARAVNGAVYDLLPALLARRVEGQEILLGETIPIRFYRVPQDPFRKGIELLSWPPLPMPYGKNGQVAYYSFRLVITVALVPFDAQPRVYVRVGLRRWVSGKFKRPGRQRISLYLRAEMPGLKGQSGESAFQVAFARNKREQDPKNNEELINHLYWDYKENIPDLLEKLGVEDGIIPSPEDVAETPINFLMGDQPPNIAMSYSTRMGSHPVNPGVTPNDRMQLLNQLGTHWDDLLTVAPRFKRSKGLANNDLYFANPKKGETPAYHGRWLRIAQQFDGQTIRIEIHYRTELSRNQMLSALANLLEIDAQEGNYEKHGVTLQVVAYETGNLSRELAITKQKQEAVDQRRNEVVSVLGEVSLPTVALVEILDKPNNGKADVPAYPSGRDPKQALRAGFADSGRLTQFFLFEPEKTFPEGKTEKEQKKIAKQKQKAEDSRLARYQNAVLDALRQMGVHDGGTKSHNAWNLTPWGGMSAAGFYVAYQTGKTSVKRAKRCLPVLTYIDGFNGQVLAWVPGMESMLPYHQVLVQLGQGKLTAFEKPDQVAQLVHPVIEEYLSNRDVLLAVHTSEGHMRNRVWPWLQDGRIQLDEIHFAGHSPWRVEDSDMPGLRVVRVRDLKDQGEVPEWYAPDGKGDAGLTDGLWKVTERVFGSIATRASSQQYPYKGKSKASPDFADKNTPMPVFHELTVAYAQPEDQIADLAAIVHSLREASVQSRDETSHTLPLHFAQRVKEYLLWEEEDALPDEESEEDE
ncbi:DUF3962 domain-containing protein [Phototrophicus methaneseepsis]|uniref:DUF3962 domain-containing protein n=1 Tax=Phototrophicus methaneseepsis TaxID=2710758 RepID=A0A7S8E794_9CHLR|nr:DUF3962 domain-containing protein [Phototrophicus methaneseepsis]QPC81678.1 DUF3962 domain-containing protein [Phototrophicus methaneseepsis]